MVSNLVAPAWAGDDTPKYLQQVADNEGAHLVAALIGLVGALLLIPGLMGVIHLLRRRRVGVGQIGAALFAIGAVMSVGLFVFTVMDIAMVDVNADRTQMVALSDRAEESVAASVFFLLYVAGFVLAAAFLLRRYSDSGRDGRPRSGCRSCCWSRQCLESPRRPTNKLLAVISRSLLAVALGAIGMKLLSLTDEEWGRWQAPPDRPRTGGREPRSVSHSSSSPPVLAIISAAAFVGSSGAQQPRPPDGDAWSW